MWESNHEQPPHHRLHLSSLPYTHSLLSTEPPSWPVKECGLKAPQPELEGLSPLQWSQGSGCPGQHCPQFFLKRWRWSPFAHLTSGPWPERLPWGTCSDTKININYPVMLLCTSYALSRLYMRYIQWDRYFIKIDFRAGQARWPTLQLGKGSCCSIPRTHMVERKN